MNVELQKKYDTWLEAIIAPIDDGSGEDPRYGENFSKIKSAIENKQETDFETIFNIAIEILSKESKDLRVAGYLVFSASRLYGVEGYNFGLKVFKVLIDGFGESLYPEKEKARQAAIAWIMQDRIIHFIENNSGNFSPELIEVTQNTYLELKASADPYFEDGFSWKSFQDWMNKKLASNTLHKGTVPPPVQSADTASGVMSSEIQSDTQLTQVSRNLLNYYKKKKMYATSAALIRSIRWSDLKMPPADEGITRIESPPESTSTKIEGLMGQGQWMDAWLACEDAFMSPGGTFYFDYQRLAHQCAQQVGLSEVVNVIEGQLSSLIGRLPKITSLKFVDEKNFASSRTLDWMEQSLMASTSTQNSDAKESLSTAREKLRSSGLTTALRWLDEQPASGLIEQMRLKLFQAQLCMEDNQSLLALPLLRTMNEQVIEHRINDLDPLLALKVWRQLQFALENRQRRTKDSEEKTDIKKELNQVNHKICSTDITMASQWL